jgi:hypothetical protein
VQCAGVRRERSLRNGFRLLRCHLLCAPAIARVIHRGNGSVPRLRMSMYRP